MTRLRDERTGDVVHAGLAYLVDGDGALVYVATGGVAQLVDLGRLLNESGTS